MGSFQQKTNTKCSSRWEVIYQQIISLIPKIDCTVVKWIMPPENVVKINTDGSRDAIGRAGTGGICRDHCGKIIIAFTQSIGRDTSNMAKSMAALNGLE